MIRERTNRHYTRRFLAAPRSQPTYREGPRPRPYIATPASGPLGDYSISTGTGFYY